jgi:hypothetical protein
MSYRGFRCWRLTHRGHRSRRGLKQPAATVTPPANAGQPYDFTAGAFYALDSNTVIKSIQSTFSGAHSDIRHPEVLWAVASAANLTH